MKRRVWLGERIDLGQVQADRVDRDARIIHGVKVLGLESRNGRRYTEEAVKQAAALYEGKSVRVNHPRKATDQRDTEDVLGWLENVQIRPDGLYADLHYLDSHPMAARICEAAERRPDLFGLSHNADGSTEVKGGEVVVLEITEVRSVDLVADPATVDGLFEGVNRVPTKLKQFMEAAGRKLGKAHKRLIARLFEDDMMSPDTEIIEPPPAEAAPAEDHVAALRTGFEGSIHAIVAAVLDGEMDEKEATKKIKELFATHGKLTDGGGKEKPVEESDEEEEEVKEACDDEDKKPMKESTELKLLRREKRARVLCEEAGVQPDTVLLEALALMPSEARMKAMIEREKGKGQQGSSRSKPRTQTVTEGRQGTGSTREIKDGKGFAASLREGRFSGN